MHELACTCTCTYTEGALLRSLYKLRSSYISAAWSSLNAMNLNTRGQMGNWMTMSSSFDTTTNFKLNFKICEGNTIG